MTNGPAQRSGSALREDGREDLAEQAGLFVNPTFELAKLLPDAGNLASQPTHFASKTADLAVHLVFEPIDA